jgi:hypothetical protein
MSAIATAIVSMLSALLPVLTGVASPTIDAVINVLIALIPEAVNEVQQVGPIIASIIAALRGNTAITQAQLEALAAVETQYDAAFEAAATAAGFPAPTS